MPVARGKLFDSAPEALKGLLADGQTLAVGGWIVRHARIADRGLAGFGSLEPDRHLQYAGVDCSGLGLLLETRQIRKVISLCRRE